MQPFISQIWYSERVLWFLNIWRFERSLVFGILRSSVSNLATQELYTPTGCVQMVPASPVFLFDYCTHQTFQVPKMEVLNLIRLFWGWVSPYVSLTYSLYRWVPLFEVPEMFDYCTSPYKNKKQLPTLWMATDQHQRSGNETIVTFHIFPGGLNSTFDNDFI